jgi:hypothetical protein
MADCPVPLPDFENGDTLTTEETTLGAEQPTERLPFPAPVFLFAM